MFQPGPSRVRWFVLAMLFAATTINYLDRIVFSVLIPLIRNELHISNQQYGYVNGAFQMMYMLGFLAMGKIIDRYGTRVGYALAISWWSLAAMGHALAGTAMALSVWRGLLGIGEAGNFPAAIKSVAEWFPKKDRAFATGIFNAGSNVASMVGPPVFVAMSMTFGWKACFLITGGLGFLWLVIWLVTQRLPETHPGVNQAELAYIRSDGEEEKVTPIPWKEALRHRETWGFALAKFITDPVWWFYLYWLPPYLYDVRKFDMTQVGWALPFIYLMADVGSVAGGWVSGWLMRRGWPNGKARKTAMLLFACSMPVGAMCVLVGNPLVAVILVSVATSAHQGLSANLYTTVSDVFPRPAVATVTGIGGCLGGLGGFLFSAVIPGYVVQHFGYTPVILTMGCFHLIGVGFVHFLMGDLKPASMRY